MMPGQLPPVSWFRFLLKDEISYLAVHLKRLSETKHPLLKTAKTIFSTNRQTRGLVVLLLSKAYSVPKHILDNFDSETNLLATISKCQRELAEITDMIHVSQVLHKGIVDLKLNQSDEDIDNQSIKDLHLGNTISLLIGDFLLAQASRGLALIRNPTITGLMAEGIGNYCEAEFLKSELLGKKNSEALEKYCYLSGGSLVAHSCRSAILLANYNQKIQNEAFLIGKHIGIAFQLSDLLFRQSVCSQKSDDFDEDLKIFDSNSIQLLLRKNVEKSLDLIKELNSSEATKALTDIVLNIENNQNL